MRTPLQRLTEHQAQLVYAVLVRCAGASSDPDSQATFVFEFTSETPASQHRFEGWLGFGGKFRFPSLTVDFYPEDATPEREHIARETNRQLAVLLVQFDAARAQRPAGTAEVRN